MRFRPFLPCGALAALLLAPALAAAQTIAPGTIELAALTGLSGNRQSITTEATNQAPLGDVGFTSLTLGLDATYFVSPRFGVGVLISYQRISLDVPERDAVAKLAGGYYGPYAQFRVPLDDRSALVLSGSIGGIRTIILNRNTGFADDVDIHAYGQYWLAGGGLSFALRPNTTFDAGVRYQSSTFTTPDNVSGKASAAGLLVGLGVAVYFH